MTNSPIHYRYTDNFVANSAERIHCTFVNFFQHGILIQQRYPSRDSKPQIERKWRILKVLPRQSQVLDPSKENYATPTNANKSRAKKVPKSGEETGDCTSEQFERERAAMRQSFLEV